MQIQVKKYRSKEFVFAEVDELDFESLSKYKWRLDSHGYALTGLKSYMARTILGASASHQFVDHVDGNPLNNRRANLRIATNSENQANRKFLSLNTSGYRGVTWHKKCRKWQAGIKKNGKSFHLGVYETKEEAYSAYKKAAENLFGQFAQHISESAA